MKRAPYRINPPSFSLPPTPPPGARCTIVIVAIGIWPLLLVTFRSRSDVSPRRLEHSYLSPLPVSPPLVPPTPCVPSTPTLTSKPQPVPSHGPRHTAQANFASQCPLRRSHNPLPPPRTHGPIVAPPLLLSSRIRSDPQASGSTAMLLAVAATLPQDWAAPGALRLSLPPSR